MILRVRQFAHEFDAVQECPGALRGAHGRAAAGILRAGRHLAQQQARLAGSVLTRGNIARHAAVHHGEGQAMLARQHTHGGAASQKVFHHLPGHITGEGRHPARGQTVVARKDDHLRLVQRRGTGAQNVPQPEGQGLQPAERAQWLGFVVQLVLQELGDLRIGQVGNRGQVCGHGVFLLKQDSAQPERACAGRRDIAAGQPVA